MRTARTGSETNVARIKLRLQRSSITLHQGANRCLTLRRQHKNVMRTSLGSSRRQHRTLLYDYVRVRSAHPKRADGCESRGIALRPRYKSRHDPQGGSVPIEVLAGGGGVV